MDTNVFCGVDVFIYKVHHVDWSDCRPVFHKNTNRLGKSVDAILRSRGNIWQDRA